MKKLILVVLLIFMIFVFAKCYRDNFTVLSEQETNASNNQNFEEKNQQANLNATNYLDNYINQNYSIYSSSQY